MIAYRLVFAALLAAQISPGNCQTVPVTAPLTVEDVVKLTKEGFAEDVIATKIKRNGKAFDLNAEELVELKKLGVADNIIKLLLDPSQPFVPTPRPEPPPPAPKPAVPSRKFPEDRYASLVPPEPGLYHFRRNVPVQIDIKLLLGTKQGAGLGKVLLKKGKVIAYLVGPAAKLRIDETSPVFYLRMPEGKGIEEVQLVALDRKDDRREIDMGPPSPKPDLKSETFRQFDSLEVGVGLFRLAPMALGKGEYMFYLMAAAEPAKGNYGKGYDFGMDAPAAVRKH